MTSTDAETRYVLRSGEVVHSLQHPRCRDLFCYSNGDNLQTCLLLSDKAEHDFLDLCRSEAMYLPLWA